MDNNQNNKDEKDNNEPIPQTALPNDVIKPDKPANDTNDIKEDDDLNVVSIEESPQATNNDNQDNTDQIVDNIVRQESDTVIALDDEKRAKIEQGAPKPKGIKKFVHWVFHCKWLRRIIALIIIASIIVFVAVPDIRYKVMNFLGFNASLTLKVVDSKTGRPIKNVFVSVQDKQALTNETGDASFSELDLGESVIKFSKRSFAPKEENIIIGWGSNPTATAYELTPTGTTFTYTVTDWLTGDPINKATVSDGDSEAVTDEFGSAKLTIEPTDEEISTTVSADGYITAKVTISADTTDAQKASLVLSKKDVYISNRDGIYGLYARHIDGSDDQVLIKGAGEDIKYLINPYNNLVAVSSSLEGKRSSSGVLLQNLYIVDSATKEQYKLDNSSSMRIVILGWFNDTIVYWKDNLDYQSQQKDANKIIAYNTNTKQSKELSQASSYSSVRMLDDTVYYIVTNADEGSQSVGLNKIKIDGSGKQTLIAGNIWSLSQQDTLKLYVSAENNKWYTVAHPSGQVETLEGSPPSFKDIEFVANAPHSQYSYIENRDGKGALLTVKSTDPIQQSKEIIKVVGMRYPLTWLNDNTIIYSVYTSQESGNYVLSLDKKTTKRIGDSSIISNFPY